MIPTLKIGNRLFDLAHSIYLIGILNITPDSFSDGGKFLDPEKALEQALQMQEEGADILDIGAESTRPGSQEVPIEEETKRLLPILNKIASKIQIPISIDTRKASVAQMAMDYGASLINDVSGFQFDSSMISLLQKTNIPAILMHSRGIPETMSQQNQYESIVKDILLFFETRIHDLEKNGISKEKLLIDPGIGFAKVGKQNVELLSKLDQFKILQRPIVVGLSKKSFLKDFFESSIDPEKRKIGTEVAHALAVLKGVNFLRVHEVKAAKQTIRFTQNFLS